jgi:competence protein ComEC
MYLPAPHGALLKAMVLGMRGGLFANIKDPFVKTGTVHILAISGLHVGLIAFILYVCFNALRINRQAATLLTLGALVIYMLVTGSRIPVVRATTMVSVVLIGSLFRRDAVSFNSLGLAAIILLLLNPRCLFSPSFQLSFAAVCSILCLTPTINTAMRVDALTKYKNVLAGAAQYSLRLFSVSLAAWLGVLPLVAYHFNLVTMIAIPGNIIVIPLTFLIIASSLSLIACAFLFQRLADVFAATTGGLLHLLQLVTTALSRLPGACLSVPSPPVPVVALYYILLIVLCAYRKRQPSWMRRTVLILFICNIAIWLQLVR